MSTSNVSGYDLASPQPIEMRVYDNELRPVDRGVGSLTKQGLTAGIYRLELRAGASSSEKLIKLQPQQTYTDRNLQLAFSSVLPLPSTNTFDQAHLNALQGFSAQPGLILGGADAELVVFVRVVSRELSNKPNFDIGSIKIELVDTTPVMVNGIEDASHFNSNEGWYGVGVRLGAGGYLLRIGSGERSMDQVLFLSKNWQTLVCVPFDDDGPKREATSIQMLPMWQGGFVPTLELNQELALALEVATTGLAAGRSLVPLQQIRDLMDRKFWNPMLGIIGAYCMFDPIMSPVGGASRKQRGVLFGLKSQDDAAFLNTVITNLSGLLPDHPDVAALSELYREATGQVPAALKAVACPPMVSIGYKQLLNFDDEGGLSIEMDSLADRARSWAAACGPWTAWLSENTRKDMVRRADSVSFADRGFPNAGGFLAPSDLGIVSRYLREVAQTEEQPEEVILNQFSDEDVSANTGLRTSVVRLARQMWTGAWSMSGRHGLPLRGLMSTKSSPLFHGRFGRLFRSLHPAKFGDTEQENIANLAALASRMSADFDPPRDGKDEEESGIPALYTYLGQFIDHDITFDPASSLQKQNDPDALIDFRTPAFDLDNVYGRGPDDQPYMYDGGSSFLLGNPITGASSGPRDLARNSANPARALIGDPRNDENVIVSQLHGLFLRLHNRAIKDNPRLEFADVQRLVRFHYQFVVLNDFLPRIVHSSVLRDLKSNGKYDPSKLKFFHWKHEPFMPIEFSVAAYRLGHSMIRPGYRLNDNDQTLLPIFPVPSQGLNEGLTGFRALNPAWGIDWGRFVDIDVRKYDGSEAENKKRLQFAYRIDTSLVNPLSGLPLAVASSPPSLPQRNLERGWRLGLPSGQHVAHAMGVPPLSDKDIIIGKGTAADPDAKSISDLGLSKVFSGNCPLWTYILAEAMHFQESVTIPVQEKISIKTPHLGPVGGRIVAEVFLGLMFGDRNSLLTLRPEWKPPNGNFALKDLIRNALGEGPALGFD
jgi:hypothetical protein